MLRRVARIIGEISQAAGRLVVGTVVGAVAVGALVGAGLAVAGIAIASAQTSACLPAPNLLFSEVDQVAGVDSQLWADLQSVETSDAAGPAASSQVIQDMLAVVTRDGYLWDCTSNVLVVAAPTASTAPILPAAMASPLDTGAPTTTTSVSVSGTGLPPAAVGAGSTGTSGQAPNAPLTGAPAAVRSGGTIALSSASSTPGDGSSSQIPVLVLGGLALASTAFIVVLIRRQMTRY